MKRRRNADHDDLPERVHGEYGVWQYPFDKVKIRQGEGWFIDWLEDPFDLPIRKIEADHLVADHALNMTPYWRVKYVDEDAGKIWLEPTEANPFLSGVGAGGATITDYDWRVATGEEHQRRVDRALEAFSSGVAVDTSEVKALLLGIVPVQFGPNGAQGGWYSSGDTSCNVGGRRRMSPTEIVMKDAAALAKMGFDVPRSALDGTLSSHAWDRFVEGSYETSKEARGTLLEGEDWNDPEAMEAFVRNHPAPKIKIRNFDALVQRWDPYPRAEIDRATAGLDYDDPEDLAEFRRIEDGFREAWRAGKYADPEVGVRVGRLIDEIGRLRHPAEAKVGFDPYWLLREKAIRVAQAAGWIEALQEYEEATDPTNRRYVAIAWKELENVAGLERMESRERHPEPLRAILEGLEAMGQDALSYVDADPERYRVATTRLEDNTGEDYERGELAGWIARRRRKHERHW